MSVSTSVLAQPLGAADASTQSNSFPHNGQIIRPWRELLRTWPVDPSETIEARATCRLDYVLRGAPDGLLRFLAALFRTPGYTTVQRLAYDLAVHPSALNARFLRAGVPLPKKYITAAQLVRAAGQLGAGARILDVALALGISDRQSLERIIRGAGFTVSKMRQPDAARVLLDGMLLALVLPYRAQLMTFDPLASARGWRGNGRQ